MTIDVAVFPFGALIQQIFGRGGTGWHHVGHSGYGYHSGGEASRSQCRRNTFPLVLFVVLQRFPGAKVEAPLFAEGFVVGCQLAFDEILRFLLVHRTEQIPLNPGQRYAAGHWLPANGRGPQLRYLRHRHRITHSGTHVCFFSNTNRVKLELCYCFESNRRFPLCEVCVPTSHCVIYFLILLPLLDRESVRKNKNILIQHTRNGRDFGTKPLKVDSLTRLLTNTINCTSLRVFIFV